MAPRPCATITGTTYLQPKKAVFKLNSICPSHTSSGMVTGSPGAAADIVHQHIDATVPLVAGLDHLLHRLACVMSH